MSKAKINITKLTPDEKIIRKIYIVRRQKVMLDFDLAALYEVETGYLKRQVRRNIERFPDDFLFELTEEEFTNLRSQFGTSSWGGRRYKPYAFTEQGIAMLSGVINSPKAIAMNIAIMRAFVEIRKIKVTHKNLASQLQILEERIGEHDVQLNSIYAAIENLLDDKVDKELKENAWKKRKRIGFKSDA
jgi:phage regulator Rha-like protein